MADYVNLCFKNYISDKDINEKILTENLVPSNPQEVPALDDFVKTLLISHTVATTRYKMEKFQENFFEIMGPLLRLWKGSEDVRNESSEVIEQTTLLGQASLSIPYACPLNILKTLLKDSRKAKTLLKEKTALLQEDEGHLFCEKFCLHLIQIERSKKKSLEVSNSDNKKNTPL